MYLKKNYYLIFSTILYLVFMINMDTVFGVTYSDIGASNVHEYQKCSEGKWNGCIKRGGYRYTIVKDVNYYASNPMDVVNYTTVSGSYDAYSFEAPYYTWEKLKNKIKNNTNGLLTDILQNTGVTLENFIANNYYMLVEPYFYILYDSAGKKSCNGTNGCYINDKYFGGFAKELATEINNTESSLYEDLTGLRNVLQLLPCTLYMPVSGNDNDKYCIDDPVSNKKTIQKYLDLAKENPRFGKGFIRADEIPEQKGILEIKKTNDLGNPVQGAEFTVYKDSNCTQQVSKGKTNVTGIKTFNLSRGEYYLKETKKASQNYSDPPNTCSKITITAGNKVTKNYTNNLVCQGYVNLIVGTDNKANTTEEKQRLIELYNGSFTQNGETISVPGTTTYNGLLNFENPRCEPLACEYDKNVGCLSARFDSDTFSSKNLSCYTNRFAYNTNEGYKQAFCKTVLQVSSSIGSGPFSAKAGQMYIKTSDGKALSSSLITQCYLMWPGTEENYSLGNYSNYIKTFTFGGTELTPDGNPEISISRKVPIDSTYYTSSVAVNHYFKKIYANNLTGKIEEESNTCSTCKFLGYGKISKLTDNFRDEDIKFEFELIFDDLIFVEKTKHNFSGTCKYTITPELVKNGKLKLVFRAVNTKVRDGRLAFLNKNGNVRKAKSNWESKENIIVENNDSYNKTGRGAKYSIKLTPADIKVIRNYNKQTSYDDYRFRCNETDGCWSVFLTGLLNKGVSLYNPQTGKTKRIGSIKNALEVNYNI